MNLEPKDPASSNVDLLLPVTVSAAATLQEIVDSVPFIPLGDRVLVLMDEADKKVGSLYVPETSQERPIKGTVVAVGPGVHNIPGNLQPLTLKVGDRVMFGKYAPMEVLLGPDRKDFYVMREMDVIGILRE